MSNGWKPPQKRSTLLDDIPQAGYKVDELAVPYKGLKKGESYVFRILTFEPGEAFTLPMRKCAKTYVKKEGGATTYQNIPVPDPGHPFNQQIIDDGDVAMSDREVSKLYRTPVLLLYKCDEALNQVGEDIWEVRYLEYTPGIATQLKELQDDIEDGLGFEAIPDYDIRLKIVDNNGIKNYEIKPVRKIKQDGRAVDCPHFQVPLEDMLGDEWLAFVSEAMGPLVEHLEQLEKEDLDPENVKKQFQRYKETKETKEGAPAKPGPAMKPAPSRKPVEQEPVEPEGEPVDETGVETSTGAGAPSKPPAGKYPPIKPKR